MKEVPTGCFTSAVGVARIFIYEWHFGDERWVFNVGDRRRLCCDPLSPELRDSLLEVWDEPLIAGVAYTAGDMASETPQSLSGVIVGIVALKSRYPSRHGGMSIPHSGTARSVREARGWTGEVDFTVGIVDAFVIDLELDV